MELHKPARSPFYYARFEIDGHYYNRSTKQTTLRDARAEGKRIQDLARAGVLPTPEKAPPPTPAKENPTYTDLIAAYTAYATEAETTGDIQRPTWQGNIAALRRFLAAIGEKTTDPVNLSRDTHHAYRTAATRGLNPAERTARATTTNATLRFTRSLVSRAALDHYHRTKSIRLDEAAIAGFNAAPFLPEPTKAYRPPSAAQITALDRAGWALRDSPDPTERELHKVFLLFRYFGLRNSEILFCRPEWFEQINSSLHLVLKNRADMEFKAHGEEERYIEAHPSLAPHLRAILATTPADQYLICPNKPSRKSNKSPTSAYGLIYRTHSTWVKAHIPTGSKTSYNLRKLYGSEVLTATGSIEAAAAALRNTPQVARQHYAALLTTPTSGSVKIPPTNPTYTTTKSKNA